MLKPHLGVGFTAGDEECFEIFKDMIYPIVKGWHQFDPYTGDHNSDLNPMNLKFSREQQVHHSSPLHTHPAHARTRSFPLVPFLSCPLSLSLSFSLSFSLSLSHSLKSFYC